jgi:glutamyl-tRNA reductase
VNLLVVGASHHTAELSLLERLALPAGEVPQVLERLLRRDHVTEAVALSTCNRVEFYVGVSGFHGGVADVSAALAERAGVEPGALAPHLYVRWDGEAVNHVLRVAAGLDSMVVGESQILGQLRSAYTTAADADATGRLLHDLMQHALRVGKRVQAETGIGATGRSVVTAALDLAAAGSGLAGRRGLVIGAGAMGALALTGLVRAGAGPLLVASRRPEKAARLAEAHGARPVDLATLDTVLPEVDILVTATTSTGPILRADAIAAAVTRRPGTDPLVICDLAVPRDVEPAAADLAGVLLIDTDRLAAGVPAAAVDAVRAAEELVAAEAETIGRVLRDARVAPTVAALRTRADELVAAELFRLAQRRPDLTDEQRAEVAHTVHRLVQQLLHQPTVRVRQLAAQPEGEAYASLLAELFDLTIDGTAATPVPRPTRADQVPHPADPDRAAASTVDGGDE